jgi:hypothetical protein
MKLTNNETKSTEWKRISFLTKRRELYFLDINVLEAAQASPDERGDVTFAEPAKVMKTYRINPEGDLDIIQEVNYNRELFVEAENDDSVLDEFREKLR